MKQQVNERFRQWTRGATFTLAMGQTQVAVLVCIHVTPENTYGHIGWYHPRIRHWVTGIRGLEDRGLLQWRDPSLLRKKLKRDAFTKEIWTITEAGLLVVELLKLSGVYSELCDQFSKCDKERGAYITMSREATG